MNDHTIKIKIIFFLSEPVMYRNQTKTWLATQLINSEAWKFVRIGVSYMALLHAAVMEAAMEQCKVECCVN